MRFGKIGKKITIYNMENYLEMLENGDSFSLDNSIYIVSCDFKKDGSRLCLSIKTGNTRWYPGNTIVKKNQLYTLDKDNNIIAIKESKKQDESHKDKNFS